ncbi:MAG: putative porin, partial [Chitinophagales bacterium]
MEKWMFIKKNLLLVFCCSTLVSIKSYTQIISDSISIDSSSQEEYYDASNAVVEYYVGDDIENFRDIDTSLNNFQQFNPARSGRFQQTYLTNIGAATIQKFFVLNRTVGFDHGRNQFDLYKFYVDSVKYYRANTPYTNLFYVLGSKSEQIFAATHTQNFGPQINATIDFKKIASEGSYLHDRKENSNIALSSWYRTKNNIYRIQGAFVHNKINNDENAGVQFDGNVFTQASAFDFNVNRSSTATDWKNFEIQVQQTFDLARKKEYAVNDSTTGFYNEPYLQLTHTFGYHDYDYMFEDLSTDTSYYPGKFVVMDTLRDVSD